MTACKQIRVHSVVVDCFSDPGLHRIQCCMVLHHSGVMVSVNNELRIVYPLVRSEYGHIGLVRNRIL